MFCQSEAGVGGYGRRMSAIRATLGLLEIHLDTIRPMSVAVSVRSARAPSTSAACWSQRPEVGT